MRALIDWRAGCGKSACPVLREGWGSNAPFLPLFECPSRRVGVPPTFAHEMSRRRPPGGCPCSSAGPPFRNWRTWQYLCLPWANRSLSRVPRCQTPPKCRQNLRGLRPPRPVFLLRMPPRTRWPRPLWNCLLDLIDPDCDRLVAYRSRKALVTGVSFSSFILQDIVSLQLLHGREPADDRHSACAGDPRW